jgi:chemotaxis protein methyltransferase CheR
MAPASAAATRDDYVRFCQGIHALTRIDLLQYKRAQMERRIRSFAQQRGATGLPTYLDQLKRSSTELDAFLDRVTINVSQLWRNPEQWQVLARELVPTLAATGRIRAWSAGCSYGAEAYTVAATCLTVAPDVRCEVIGTDIDQRMVARAREGVFSVEDARTAPAASLERWFERFEGGYRARSELRRHLRFEIGDLLVDRVRVAAYDLVLCRNVVIYFTEPVRDDLHRRLAESVRPGGFLIVGATERIADAAGCGLEPVSAFTYRKR